LLLAWLKIRLPNGGTFKGKTYRPGASVEIKIGSLASWNWEQLISKHTELQGRADRGEPLVDVPEETFADAAENWLSRAEKRARAFETERIATRKYLIPAFGEVGLKLLSTSAINRWIAQRLRVGFFVLAFDSRGSAYRGPMFIQPGRGSWLAIQLVGIEWGVGLGSVFGNDLST
jgi:hypothetical protein